MMLCLAAQMKKSKSYDLDFLAGAEGLGLGSTTQSRGFDFGFATRLGQAWL